jgi:hypothetical protein
MSLDVHIEEVRKLKGQHDNLDIINKIIMDSSDGQNIELQNTSISIINLRNPIYFILPSINSEEGISVFVKHVVALIPFTYLVLRFAIYIESLPTWVWPLEAA